MSTLRIGRCGELLVQYKLLKLGIESAPLTTDAGIDLVAYAPGIAAAVTIQVKANDKPKPGAGGKGKLALDWWLADDCPAEFAAFADVSTDSVWLMSKDEVAAAAQQHANGKYHLYMYCDPTAKPRVARPAMQADFDKHRLERKVRLLWAAS